MAMRGSVHRDIAETSWAGNLFSEIGVDGRDKGVFGLARF
jgi:hypothetical protein